MPGRGLYSVMDDISVEWITSEHDGQWERNNILYNIPERNNNNTKKEQMWCVYVLVMSVLFSSENYILIVRCKMVSTPHARAHFGCRCMVKAGWIRCCPLNSSQYGQQDKPVCIYDSTNCMICHLNEQL